MSTSNSTPLRRISKLKHAFCPQHYSTVQCFLPCVFPCFLTHCVHRYAVVLAVVVLCACVPLQQISAQQRYLYWANGASNTIGRVAIDGSDFNPAFIRGCDQPTGVAIDIAGNRLYWTNYRSNSIGRANLSDGSGVNHAFIVGCSLPTGLAVDFVNQRIYWTNQGTNAIGRATLDGGNVEQGFITGCNIPQGIVVDMDNSRLWWANQQGNSLGVASFDARTVNQNFIRGCASPRGVAVDAFNNRIYWINQANSTIGRATLDGTAINQNFLQGGVSLAGIWVDVPSNALYWTGGLGGTSFGRSALNDGSNILLDQIRGLREPYFMTGMSIPTVTGRVSVDGRPFAGVVVSDGSRSVITDTLGRFMLMNVPNGTYIVRASIPQFTFFPESRTVSVQGNGVSQQNFTAFAEIPAGPARNLRFTDVNTSAMTLQWEPPANGTASRYVVVVRESDSLPRFVPTNGTSPDGVSQSFLASRDLGNGEKVVYDGPATSATVSGLRFATNYTFTIYPSNGTGGVRGYQTVNPLSNGRPTLAVSPITRSSSLIATMITSNSAEINWVNGIGTGRILLIKANMPPSVPTSGEDENFFPNPEINRAPSLRTDPDTKVAAFGDFNGPITVSGLLPGTTYFVSLHEFNGSGRSISYGNATPEFSFATTSPPTFQLSGSVVSPGTTVTLSGSSSATIVSDINGNYTFRGLFSGRYTVTPSLFGFTFSPTSATVQIFADNVRNVNFRAIVLPPPPIISQFIPASASVGSQIIISGEGFVDVQVVRIGGIPVTNFTVDSPSQIRATIPLNGMSGQIFVQTARGSFLSTNVLTVTPLPITILSVQPTTTTATGRAFSVQISGIVGNVARAEINGAFARIIPIAPTVIAVEVPENINTYAGFQTIILTDVTNQRVSLPIQILQAPRPVIDSLLPGSRAADGTDIVLSIEGRGFFPNCTVQFAGTTLTPLGASPNRVLVIVPGRLNTVVGQRAVTVNNNAGSTQLADYISVPMNLNSTFLLPPIIVDVEPSTTNATSRAFTMTLNGYGFQPGVQLFFNNQALPVIRSSSTQIVTVIPATLNQQSGTFELRTVNTDRQSFSRMYTISVTSVQSPSNLASNAVTNLRIYPNPAQEAVTVEACFAQPSAYRVVIRDVLGTIVVGGRYVTQESCKEHTISLQGLPVGVYTVEIQEEYGINAGMRRVERFVKWE